MSCMRGRDHWKAYRVREYNWSPQLKLKWMEEGRRLGNPDVDRCHTCRGDIVGRPFQLERIIGLN